MDSIKLILILLLVFSPDLTINSQVFKRPEYYIETGATLSAGTHTPFWLFSNQYGLIKPSKNNEWIRLGLKTSLSDIKKIDFDYGFEITDRYNLRNELYLNQAYVRQKLFFVNIQVGAIEEKFGNQDSSLSSGGLLWSGNARPIPKVSIIVPDYTPVPLTHGFLEFKGGISHGWFGDSQFMKNSWLHHKYIYLQFGGRLPVHMSYGFHHFAQWGGESTDPGIGKMPNSFGDFFKVFFAKEGGTDANLSDQLNVLGNHLGSNNFRLDVLLSKIKIGVYWQTIFEDSSGMKFQNIHDGLFGIYLLTKEKDRLINGFVYEFINTSDQSGPGVIYYLFNGIYYSYPVPGSIQVYSGGNDNYFNHGLYQAGWTYKGMTIGTPLITSPAIYSGAHPEANYIMNNRIIGHHFGLEGMYKDFSYKFLFTYYLNYGTMLFPLETKEAQYSLLLQSQIKRLLPWGVRLGVSIGFDHGMFYGNNAGLKITLHKSSAPGD